MGTKPPQTQERQPGLQTEMRPEPQVMPRFPGSGRLAGKTAIVTGGDSGIGQAVSVLFAREGANIADLYLDEERRRAQIPSSSSGTKAAIALLDRRRRRQTKRFCDEAVESTVDHFGRVDVLDQQRRRAASEARI